MTEISRSIEISAPTDKVWSHIDPKNWTQIFHSIQRVNGYSSGKPGIGTQATVVAGVNEESAIKYNIEITEFQEKQKIEYKRFGGPLTGRGMIRLRPLQKGTLLTRTSYYDDDLSEETIQALSEGMENDNEKIKTTIESKNKK
ncbi:SRPBCC family protein [candidate division KSB1 bacterium]|nr:SRPBCC family protein [candidate division KSB1 bacterium]NIR73000.1 SRPBCC family protein [candidate division KSB1 bacterium]NIS28274.1 SRPBCC family protein [candidate division KSB1 bacterium]NIT75146.1 SRPBCC family protein [candidate division KSB1 bacterium]NIU28953.1 SRPBCC family protein [candidate division KSB1 bacterium]